MDRAKWYLWSACGTTSVHHYGRVARGRGRTLDAFAYGVTLFNHAAERLDLDMGWETLRVFWMNLVPDSMHRKYNVETSPDLNLSVATLGECLRFVKGIELHPWSSK